MLLHRLKDTKGERTLFYKCEQTEGEEEERIKHEMSRTKLFQAMHQLDVAYNHRKAPKFL